MNEQTDKALNLEELRKHAEQEMLVHSDQITDVLMTDEKRLLHELQVHQIELEMQNQALQEALVKIEDAHFTAECEQERYLELFEFAPVAYFMLEKNKFIRKVNLCAANLLGVERRQLAGQDFSEYISSEYVSHFEQFLHEIFSSGNRQYCEIVLKQDKLR